MTEYIDKQAFKDKYLCTGYLPEMSDFPQRQMEMKILKSCGNHLSHTGRNAHRVGK